MTFRYRTYHIGTLNISVYVTNVVQGIPDVTLQKKKNQRNLFKGIKVKVKVKFTIEKVTKAQMWTCIAALFLQPRCKMGVGGRRHGPAALPPGKTRYPLYRRLGGPQGRPGRVRKNVFPAGIRSPDGPARSESLYRLS
jgi:hypothetical protein